MLGERQIKRAAALLSTTAVAAAVLLAASAPSTAAGATDPATPVGPSAVSGADVGVDGIAPFADAPRTASGSFRSGPAPRPPAAPATPWQLDDGTGILPGDWSVTPAGLGLSVVGVPGSAAASEKVRFSYFVGNGGYPAIDAMHPTLADVFSHPLSWDQTLDSGDPTYGVTLQIKLEKEIHPGEWAYVTAVSVWQPGTRTVTFDGPSSWFANTDIYSDGFLTGTLVNRAGSGPGVSRETLLENFGDFTVVSFGPNLGRDLTYGYTIQDFSILGQTFHFLGALQAGTPSVSGTAQVGQTVTASAGDGWSPAPDAFAYQWLRNGTPIPGATGTSYAVMPVDADTALSVSVTGSKDGYASASATSAATTVAPPPPGDPDAPPTVAVTVPASAADLPPDLALPVTPPPVAPTPAAGQLRTLTLDLGPGFASTWYYVTMYSSPTVIGWRWVDADGKLTFLVPQSLPAGDHTVALLDESGAVVGFVAGVPVPAAAEILTLPATGADGDLTSGIVLAGSVVVSLGLALSVAGAVRRRRTAR